ncbi:hypothetical protein [Pleurocapsa sp. FMAR1]|uniref:hypothetical protein n=1 Tax=Pleurocapsa sp. FMAR1 TaxID=3040204 RepID=UPI0029C94FDF|nr:hypothetical protein [Pleurocapsa sp. FMAR1]
MRNLQNISLVAVSILGLTTIELPNADALTSNNMLKLLPSVQSAKNTVELAQKPATSTDESSPQTEDEMVDALQKRQEKLENFNKLQDLQEKDNSENLSSNESLELSQPLAFKLLTIGLPAALLVILVSIPIVKGITGVFKSNIGEKFGKPKVPEGSVILHNRAFKEITVTGNNAEKINDEKFGNEEFKQLIMFNINVAKKTEGYPELYNSVELLKAAIIAQKSFLKLESTELRYRSRKQQEFYKYVADNLAENVDKEAFAQQVKNKQAEVLPLINTEEGREAIDAYAKEIDVLSRYSLGLKLLSLFKKYELQDFSTLKRVSDVVESLQARELLSPQDLISSVLENYESFDKLAPILGITEAKNTAKAYAIILQILGLMNRHGKSYIQFEQLVELLKKWEKPYKHIAMVRQEYTSNQYQIPQEFKEDIPGINVYQKYAKYLPDL